MEQPEAHDSTSGLDNRKMLMWAFLASECLFFGSLISTYLVYRGKSLTGPFPHEVFNIPYTSISAFVLLMSSLTMVLALAALQRAEEADVRRWLGQPLLDVPALPGPSPDVHYLLA